MKRFNKGDKVKVHEGSGLPEGTILEYDFTVKYDFTDGIDHCLRDEYNCPWFVYDEYISLFSRAESNKRYKKAPLWRRMEKTRKNSPI